MDSKSADIFGWYYILFQWLSVLQVINPLYNQLQLETFAEFQTKLNQSNDILLKEYLKTFSDEAVKRNEQMKDNIAGV